MDLFYSMTPEDRDTYYASSLADEAIQVYKDDEDFAKIQGMTTEGKIALLESGYMTDDIIDFFTFDRTVIAS